ncbi:hypothetical protein Leryth_011326 [Lithospermum erythrorhizon]|nr:hypothetical protein Leryth_011326 [Lithospermum erythrorhizon]
MIVFIILFGFKTTAILVLVLFTFYVVGFVYLSLIWQLGCVVSFFEDVYGLRAMMKSQNLIKGKLGISLLIFLIVGLCGFWYSLQYDWNVVIREKNSVFSNISFGALCLMLQTNFMLMRLMIHTVSFRRVNIDKSSLSDDLEVYL